MLSRRSVWCGVALIASLLAAESAWATIDNQKSYKAAYPGQEPKAYSCKVCHQGVVGKKGDLNAYGTALQQFKAEQGAKKLTEEDYQAFDAADTDGDGAANAQELEAGTDPFDTASVPALEPSGESVEDHEQIRHPEGEETEKPHSALPRPHGRLSAYLDQLMASSAWAETAEQAAAPSAEAPTAEYVGTETCAACHQKQFKEFQQSTHARIAIPGEDVKAQGCEMCHGPGSLHVDAGGGKGVGGIINPRKDPSTCFECHLDKKAEFRNRHHHPLLEGKMSCADCHEAHGADVRPWSSTTLKDVNEACFRCHKEQRGPFVWEHEALRDGCTTCHKVHGSIHEKMLLARDYNLCLRCHTQANFPTIGKRSHATYLPSGTCFSAGCHTAVHGSNFDDHLRY